MITRQTPDRRALVVVKLERAHFSTSYGDC